MKRLVLAMAFAGISTACFAADATAPVKVIMDIAQKSFSGGSTDDWYFDEAHLKLFSENFVKTYREAEKHPAYDTDTGVGSPFDYDVIVMGQDSCELKKIKITAGEAVDGTTPVNVSFNNKSCMEGAEAKDISHLTFVVVEEGGKAVIDDILREGEGTQETTNSLRDEMDQIIKG